MNRIGAVLPLLCALITAACSSGPEDTLTPAERASFLDEVTGPSHVAYHVEGTADTVSITMATETGTEQAAGQRLPLRARDGQRGIRFDVEPGEFVYIAAQNEGTSGTVTCSIEVNGQVVSENTATGSYTIATCDGTA